jgi:hypothetical protein
VKPGDAFIAMVAVICAGVLIVAILLLGVAGQL